MNLDFSARPMLPAFGLGPSVGTPMMPSYYVPYALLPNTCFHAPDDMALGYGNIGACGDISVVGEALLEGTVPVGGNVCFEGGVPAYGKVTIMARF